MKVQFLIRQISMESSLLLLPIVSAMTWILLRNVRMILICAHGIQYLLTNHEAIFYFSGKITRNLALDRYRESNRLKRSATIVELTGELSEIIAGNDDATANAESEELKNYINSFLRTLHKEKRNVFIRRYWYMDSVAEIADRYGISEGKIKTILFRVRNGLRQYLKKEGYYI